MWLLLLLLWEFLICIYSFYHPRFYFILFLALVYLLWYFDGSEYNGRRTWEQFRTLRIWKRLNPVKHMIYNKMELATPRRRLFLVCPNMTNLPLIWGYGLHAGMMPSNVDVCYMLPHFLFRIPLLRDFLLWTGAVSDKADLIKLLDSNRSVCYCPNGMRDALYTYKQSIDPNAPMTITFPPDEVFEFAMEKGVHLIPVMVANEVRRYHFAYFGHSLHRMQRVFFKHTGYPFPLVFWAKYFGPRPPPPIEHQIGAPIEARRYESVETLKDAFRETIVSLNANGVDRPIEFIN